MPITQEQERQFRSQPYPLSLGIGSVASSRIILKGREALVSKVEDQALKWYAALDGQTLSELVAYGKETNRDESDLLLAGLSPNQVPDSHFFIDKYTDGNPQLFAIQRWVEGRILKNIPLGEVIKNPDLKESLADLFVKCNKVFRQTGRFPDLIGGDKLSIGTISFQDPRKIIWPLRSPNIIIEGSTAVLVDAKKLNFDPGDYRFEVARLHSLLTLLTSRILRSF